VRAHWRKALAATVTPVTCRCRLHADAGQAWKISSTEADGAVFVEFAAEADCEILPGHRYRIVDLRTTDFIQ
jgi:hypothetical protein